MATETQSTTLSHARREVIERIKKCLARGKHAAANETEAKAAMRMASKIMQQHNISQAQIIEDEDDAQRLQRGGMSTVNIGPRTPWSKIIFETWVLDLALAICTFFDCRSFSTKKRSSVEWTFYGVAEHTASATMAFEMTHNLIQDWAYARPGVQVRNSYCLGVAHGLRDVAREELQAAERAAKENEKKSSAGGNTPLSTPFQQPSVVEIDSDEDSASSAGNDKAKASTARNAPLSTPVQRPPVVDTDSDEDSAWSTGTSTPVQRPPVVKIETRYQAPADLPRPASSELKEQLMDLFPDAEDAITKLLAKYEIAYRRSSTRGKSLYETTKRSIFDEERERRDRNFNERLERLERLERQAAVQPSTPPRLQSAPVTPRRLSASPSPFLPTPLLRAGNKRRRADDDSGEYGVGQSEPAAKRSRLDESICRLCFLPIEVPRETDDGGCQSEDLSDRDSVPAETNKSGHQREKKSDSKSVLAETDAEGCQSDDDSDDDFIDDADSNADNDADDDFNDNADDDFNDDADNDSDDDSELADFNDDDSDTLDATAPFEAELQKEVSKANTASKDPTTSEPTEVQWSSSTQLTVYRENVAKIAEEVLKAHNIKLRAGTKRKRIVKDKVQYAMGVRDSRKINVRGKRIGE